MVDEMNGDPKEVKELVLSTVTQADLLTQLINQQLTVDNVTVMTSSTPSLADDVPVTSGSYSKIKVKVTGRQACAYTRYI